MSDIAFDQMGVGLEPNVNKQSVLQKPNILDVLDVDLVREKLFDYITLDDLKSLSVCSKSASEAVRKSDAFWFKTRLILSADSFNSGVIIPRKNIGMHWKNVVLDLSLPLCVIQRLGPHFGGIHSLFLRYPYVKKDVELLKYFEEVFKNTTSEVLKWVGMDFLLFENKLSLILDSPVVKLALSQINCLILEFPSAIRSIPSSRIIDQQSENMYYLRENFLAFQHVPLRLHYLHIGATPQAVDTKEVTRFATGVVKTSWKHLKCLNINIRNVDIEYVKSVQLPNLANLSLSGIKQNEIASVKMFVDRQTRLKSLHLRFGCNLPRSLLLWLSTISKRLQCLHLKAIGLHDESDYSQNDWYFLEEMQSLRDLLIEFQRNENSDFGNVIAARVPMNCRSFSLLGVPMVSALSHVGNLQNITKLTLLGTKNSVDNASMKVIVNNLKNLNELHLSHCHGLTDAGICVLADTSREYSRPPPRPIYLATLCCLTELTKLSLLGCPNITRQCILDGLRFESLKYFAFSGSFRFSKMNVYQIVAQNPSLQNVLLPLSMKMEGILKLRSMLQIKTPNMRLTPLNTYCCFYGEATGVPTCGNELDLFGINDFVDYPQYDGKYSD